LPKPDFADRLFQESHKGIPEDIFLAYLDMLTERGYLERDPERVILTHKFMELMSRAGEHFIEWWDIIPEDDDPRELVALECSRLILGIRRKRIEGPKQLKEWGRLTGVLLRLIRLNIPDDKAREMREILNHDIKMRKAVGQYDRRSHPEPTKERP
jgi:hypothetical protein